MTMWRELQPDDPGRIGPYRLRGVLGSGGMGRVFLGVSADGDQVAVKVIRADLAMDSEFRARFRREVTVARKVSSRFTAPLLGADADGPVPWLATAYVTGPSLADAVAQRGPLPAASVLELAAGLAEGVSAIHAAGVIHRDLKPSNVLLAPDGPRVIDFGISVAAETSPLTRTGLLIGSPGYMSPEQVEGREVGPASDIFSLGAVLAFAATGEAPFGNGSAPTLAYRAVYRQVNLDRVPAEIRGLIDRCLAKDPGQRPTAREVMFAAGQDGSRTVTSARLSPVFPPAAGRPGRHEGRRQRRRPLAIASVVVGILAASAGGGIAVAGCTSQTVGMHSVTSPVTSAPATSAPSNSPTAGTAPPTSASATASATPTAITTGAPTASPTAITTGTPTASPTAITTGTPTASSSPAPIVSPSTSTPLAPSGSATPTPAAS
ncbi:MAG: protein kinase domain-containing protein [Streptosporangiaceae bacterium]